MPTTRRVIGIEDAVWEEFGNKFPELSPWLIINELLKEFVQVGENNTQAFIKEAAKRVHEGI